MLRLPRELSALILFKNPRSSLTIKVGCPSFARPQSRRHSTLTALLSVVESAGPIAHVASVGSATPWGTIGAAVVGFPLVLWVYKVSLICSGLGVILIIPRADQRYLSPSMSQCVMLVAFQRKIIYMGYLPPQARETVSVSLCRPRTDLRLTHN
jgi:hypothetical protein